MDLGIGELVVIFLVVMILFGANKLPALGEGLGKAIRGFKTSLRDEPASAPPARVDAAEPGERKAPGSP